MTTSQLREIATGEAAKRPTTFPKMLEAYKGEIARALPRHMNPDTMTRIALTCFRMNPRLAECEPASVFACVIQASQLGLRPGLMGECFLIPYKDNRNQKIVCTLQLGYQGMLELARRSGQVLSINAWLVYEKDQYAVRFGTDPGIEHIPYLDGEAGKVRLGYAVAKLTGGATHAEVMTVREINAHRDRSANYRAAVQYKKTDNPWMTDYNEMARKTLIRRICKYLPKSNELAIGMALDDSANRGTQILTVDEAIDNAFVPADVDTIGNEKSTEEQTGEQKPQPVES